MKKLGSYFISAALIAAALASSCKGPEASPAASTTSPSTPDPDVTEIVTDDGVIEEVPPLPVTSETDVSQTLPSDTEPDLGGHDAEADDITDGNKVFLVCVDPDTTKEMMDKVISEYGLGVVYDYENFNMYALSVPSPLDEEETAKFISELESKYDFILSVEPDSVVSLDGASDQ